MLTIWFCWHKGHVKLTTVSDCIWPDTAVALRLHFKDAHAVQDMANILRVEGVHVDTTDVRDLGVS